MPHNPIVRTALPLLALVASSVLALGCSTSIALTAGGQNVTAYSNTDLPSGCRVLGDVHIGIPPNAARPPTEDDLVILMRNDAAVQGGNGVLVESRREETDEEGNATHWVGRGRAYRCPEAAPPTPAEEPAATDETAGGEAEAEDGESGAESEPTDEASDDSLDDI